MPEIEARLIQCANEWEQALEIRRAVFVTEQQGPADEEPDEWDASALQLVVLYRGKVVGTARLYQPVPGTGKAGRFALLAEYRGRGWGTLLLRAVVENARAMGLTHLELHAQSSARQFYARHGFTTVGDEFPEAGIPHIKMILVLAPENAGGTPLDAHK